MTRRGRATAATSDETPPRYLTLPEASELVRTPVSTLREWISHGRLPAFRPGRRVLVTQGDLVALVSGARVGSALLGGSQ